MERQPGSLYDGKILLSEKTRPSQIPYRTLLPKEVENLIVPVCISATHVAYGTIRVEPVCMQLGEVAGFAAAIAKEQNVSPGQITADSLQHRLAEQGFALTFFNDVEIGNGSRRSVAMQYLGTKGFFPNYDARPDDQLTNGTAELWASGYFSLLREDHDSDSLARRIYDSRTEKDVQTKRSELIGMLEVEADSDGINLDSRRVSVVPESDRVISRGEAIELIYALYQKELSKS